MNLLLVVCSSIFLLSIDVLSRPSNIDKDSTLEYLFEQNDDDLGKRDIDLVQAPIEWCDKLVEGITNILIDPDIGLTPEQLRMIPEVNKKKLNKRYRVKICPQEYYEWEDNLKSFDRVLTNDQRQKLARKVPQFIRKMMESEE
jgi:hypothetical protein